jgi:hypothetical protein
MSGSERPYTRTAAQRRGDFEAAREFELEVQGWLGDFLVPKLNSTTELDFWLPGIYLDVKEKRQPISARWPLPPGVPQRDCFILDELSVRKAMEKYPSAYFLIRDVPGGDRLFLAPIYEVVGVERTRVQRVGKGKWIIDLANFRELDRATASTDLRTMLLADQVALPWKASECLSAKEVPQV